jgi:hypothetical protein
MKNIVFYIVGFFRYSNIPVFKFASDFFPETPQKIKNMSHLRFRIGEYFKNIKFIKEPNLIYERQTLSFGVVDIL